LTLYKIQITTNFSNEEAFKVMEDKKENVNNSQKDNKEEDVFETAEIKIEEMAIDGIWGVY
jgi:hypothetical protein